MAAYPEKASYTAQDLVAIVALLRDPEHGCPWDSVQTHRSIRKNFLEETYEVLEAIDADDAHMLCEELGDVMMQVALHSCMEAERGSFTFDDVCDGVCRKLIYRHPHIFHPESSDGIKDWDALKNREKGRQGLADELETVPKTFPALMKAQKAQKRAARYGAVEENAAEACAAAARKEAELKRRLAAVQPQGKGETVRENPAQEAAGDFLFAAANWLRCEGIDAEEALEDAVNRFYTEKKPDQ